MEHLLHLLSLSSSAGGVLHLSALVLGLAACGSTTPDTPKDDPQTPAETPVQDPAAPEEPQAGKTLVVYYSASGHTRQVAQAIAQAAELNKGV